MRNRILLTLLSSALLLECSRTSGVKIASVPRDWFNAPLILAVSGWPGQPAAPNTAPFALASGLASEAAVDAGNADVGLASPVVLLRDPPSAAHVRLLGCYMSSGGVLGIASRSPQPKPPYGYVRGTISEVFLGLYLDKIGQGKAYSKGAIERVALLPPAAAMALKSPNGADSIESVVIWEPHLSRAAAGAGGSVTLDPSLYTVHVCLIVNRKSYASAMRPKIDALVQQVQRASDYIQAKPDEARPLVEQLAGLDSGSLTKPWARVDFRFVSDTSQLQHLLGEEQSALEQAGMKIEGSSPTVFIR